MARRPSEGCEEGIVPDFGRERLVLRVFAPEQLKVRRFVKEGNARIAQEEIKLSPRFRQRQRVLPENTRVRRQPQETLLSQTAEETDFIRQAVEPRPGHGMVDMRVKRQRGARR